MRRQVEDLLYALINEVALIASKHIKNTIPACFNLMDLPQNPAIYENLYKIELSQNDLKALTTENQQREQKLRIFYKQVASNIQSNQSEKWEHFVGEICYPFLRAYCMTTLKERLYDLCFRMLEIANKDKKSQIVSLKKLFI